MTLRRSWLVLLLALVVVGSAFGQSSTTATLRGKIVNAQGNSVANAEINAVETATGFVHTVHSRADGTYTLGGLTPGLYNIVVAAQGYEPKSQDVTVLLGQTIDLNINMAPTAVLSESITVVGTQAVETKTSEIATNVTTQQIENLPQDSRNFLNFAAMAPGIRLSQDPQRLLGRVTDVALYLGPLDPLRQERKRRRLRVPRLGFEPAPVDRPPVQPRRRPGL